MYDNRINKKVEALRKFIIKEAEFHVAAAEALHSLQRSTGNKQKQSGGS